jgi:hypothetical protein
LTGLQVTDALLDLAEADAAYRPALGQIAAAWAGARMVPSDHALRRWLRLADSFTVDEWRLHNPGRPVGTSFASLAILPCSSAYGASLLMRTCACVSMNASSSHRQKHHAWLCVWALTVLGMHQCARFHSLWRNGVRCLEQLVATAEAAAVVHSGEALITDGILPQLKEEHRKCFTMAYQV